MAKQAAAGAILTSSHSTHRLPKAPSQSTRAKVGRLFKPSWPDGQRRQDGRQSRRLSRVAPYGRRLFKPGGLAENSPATLSRLLKPTLGGYHQRIGRKEKPDAPCRTYKLADDNHQSTRLSRPPGSSHSYNPPQGPARSSLSLNQPERAPNPDRITFGKIRGKVRATSPLQNSFGGNITSHQQPRENDNSANIFQNLWLTYPLSFSYELPVGLSGINENVRKRNAIRARS
jgi:hypothetical protein